MTRSQFRILTIFIYALATFAAFYDDIFADDLIIQLREYAETLEPEWSDTKLFVLIGLAGIGILYVLYTLIGLLLFWSMARHVYVAGYILFLPLYPLMGYSVYSGMAQSINDVTMVLSGVLICLAYTSPVKGYFEKPNRRLQRDDPPNSPGPEARR